MKVLESLERMNEVLLYIENHLAKEIDSKELARIACCSEYQFQRMFSYIADFTLSEYIRRRRLTQAGFELKNTKEKVIDIALKYGYRSPDAFTRAFLSIHGVTPTKARKSSAALKAFPKLTFQISLKGDVEMNYRIEKKEGFQVIGQKERISTINGENFVKIPQMWKEITESTYKDIISLSKQPKVILGVLSQGEPDGFYYSIASISDRECPSKYEATQIPASEWAIFEVIGPMPDAIQKVWKRIYSEWFPGSGFRHAGTPEIEWYSKADPHSDDYKSEIWIPIVHDDN